METYTGKMFAYERDCGLGEFTCPICGQNYKITEWYFDYGEPMEGIYEIDCLECNGKLNVVVVINVIFTVVLNTQKKAGPTREMLENPPANVLENLNDRCHWRNEEITG